MKKFLIKTWINISLWLEEILGIYRDVSTSAHIFETKKDLSSELENIIFTINYSKGKEKLISIKLSAIIIAVLRLSGYKKAYVTKNNNELEEQIKDCFSISIEKNELGYKYNNITRTAWNIETAEKTVKEKIILAFITLEEFKKRE